MKWKFYFENIINIVYSFCIKFEINIFVALNSYIYCNWCLKEGEWEREKKKGGQGEPTTELSTMSHAKGTLTKVVWCIDVDDCTLMRSFNLVALFAWY